MPLPSFLQRSPKNSDPERRKPAGASLSDDPGPAQEARARARRRLIGAVVLLAVGVVGFPLLFETQPRPIGLDVPIETAAAPGAERPAAQPVGVAPLPRVPAPTPVPEDAGREPVVPAAPPAASLPAASVREAPPARAAASAPPARPAASAPPSRVAAAASAARGGDGARAQALLDSAPAKPSAMASQQGSTKAAEPKASAAPGGDDKAGRFVVQVGAYTDANALREARARVERLGLKTYTQVIETDAGRRTRVRVGPFQERGDADAAARKLKAAGLPANILAL